MNVKRFFSPSTKKFKRMTENETNLTDHKNTTALGKNDAVTSAHPTQRMPMCTKMGQQQPSNTSAIKIPTAMQPTKNFGILKSII